MRFMMIVKANKESEGGCRPDEQMLAAMAKYNEEMMKAGVLLDLSGLHPSAKGFRVRFSAGDGRTVIDGPFPETKELIGGFWLIQVKSREEAVAWAKRIPFQPDASGVEPEVEVRQLFELEDFAPSAAIERARELGRQMELKKHT
ncbi:MAG: YciI family protein [Gemmataceae bacterium]